MKKFNYLTLFAAAIFILSSCGGLNKMKDMASQVKYTVTPEVLEEKGNDVAMKIDVKYPANYFNKKATLTATPVLKYAAGETAFPSKTLQGESVQANNQVINYTTGGSFSYTGNVAFKEEMMKSKLVIRAVAEMKGQKLELDEYPLADGVIATSKLVMVDPKPVMIADKFQRIIPDSYTASILYIINRYDVRTSELKKDEIKKLSDYIKNAQANERIEIQGAGISAYASPDGPLDLNDKLSKNRQGSAESYFKKELKNKKVETPEGFLALNYTPEDWDGFKKLMEESNIQDKELILRVLSMYSDPVVREKEIKNISKAYEVIADEILPQLRRSKLTVNVNLVGLSDEELKTAWKNDPNSLKMEEILYTATLYEDLNEKLAIYKKAGELFPECGRAFNNEGYVYVMMGDANNAQKAFEKAKSIKDNDAVNNNLGVCALMLGDLEKAEQLLTSSMGAGAVVNYNLGIIKIIKGDYDAAANYLGNTDEFNTALVKLLKKDFDGALATINRVEKDFAKKYYLKAVVAAKQGKDELVFESLRLALAKDSALKDRAKVDMEFAKYFENTVFKGLIE